MFLGDYHTHTKYSDAKNTIEENCQSALNKNLKELAITDHGLGFTFYKTENFKKFKKARAEVDGLKDKLKDLKIYLGVEASILSTDGEIDLTDDQIKLMDIIVCGYHRFMIPKSFKDAFLYYGYNNFISPIFKPSKDNIKRNTKAVVTVIKRYPVDIYAHINNFAVVDAYEVSKVCSDYGTYIELNEKHINQIEPIIEDILKTDVKLICDSDAHKISQIGVFNNCISLINKYNIDKERIVNFDKILTLQRHK